MKKTLLIAALLSVFAVNAQQEPPNKVDSSLRYKWNNGERDTAKWDITYGWYDTARVAKDEGQLWIFDTLTRVTTVEWNGWCVTLRFPPPQGCRCIGKYIFHEYLDEKKKPFSKTAIVESTWEIMHRRN